MIQRTICGNRVSRVGEEDLGALGTDLLHGKAKQAGPEQDADVVAVYDGADGVGHKVGQQGVQHLAQTLGNDVRFCRVRQDDGNREQKAGDGCNGRRQKRGEHVQPDDRAKTSVQLGRALRQRAGHDDKDQHRGNAFQSTDKQGAELRDPASPRDCQCQHRADDQTAQDADDQADAVVLGSSRIQSFHIVTLLHLQVVRLLRTYFPIPLPGTCTIIVVYRPKVKDFSQLFCFSSKSVLR